jgi:hypothetical protein
MSTGRSLILFLGVALSFSACGRSSMLGGSPEDCPPGLILPNGTCCPPERTLPNGTCAPAPDGGPPSGDAGLGDAGTDGAVCPPGCLGGDVQCAGVACCACASCAGTPLCLSVDMGDLCGDPKNCPLPACAGDPRCRVLGTEVCNNCIDDNDNGLTDCADPQCASFPGCMGGPHACGDPPDCTDPTCACDPTKCKDLKCHPTVDFGTLQPSPMGTTSTRMENTTGTTDVAVTNCAPGHAGMVVGKFVLAGTKESAVTVSFTQGKGEDHVFGLFRAGVNQACGDNPVGCYDPKGALSGSQAFVLPPGEYYVITQPFEPKGQGPVTVTLSTAHVPEICNNGVDDNGNGLIDCADPDCFNAPNCVNQECKPDFNVGTVVVNAPGQSVSFTTAGASTNANVSCQGTTGGGDVVVKFSLAQTAGVLLKFTQQGDHVVALEHFPPPGEKCDQQPILCFDPSGSASETVAWGEYPAGEYEFIFKALKPGDEGHIDATISAYENRNIEICHNGIDDNNNGLTDCADPQCLGAPGCSAPYCMPNVQLGPMVIGESQTTTLNVQQSGTTGYNVTCASSSAAKGMVVQLSVPSGGTNGGFGMTFDCTQTGDQVIQLDLAGGPRDPCDVNALVCADPKILPFGCGYEVPNLQPGTYNVIVEGFKPGSEGSMTLTLGIVDDRQLEICNNGIDDDMNGLTDCKDPKCFTSPLCTTSQCKPDQTINPMPLTDTNVFKLLQTAMNGVHGQVPCATATGGQSAVIQITLTAKADLTLSWNQIGNHDFALFTDVGQSSPCDAGTLTGMCVKSNGTGAGSTKLTGVPQGTYFLIVQGDQPDGTTQYSGSVDVELSGTPSP